MSLDPDILASSQYLRLGEQKEDYPERLKRTLAAAVARCESYTGRAVEPKTTGGQGLPLWGGTTFDTTATVVQRRASSSVVRIPDCRDLIYVDVLDGVGAGQYAAAQLETVSWGNADTAVWLRLPFSPVGRPLVAITGRFGMDPIPPDLEDSLYTYAARRWREADANFGDDVTWEDGGTTTYEKRLPTIVRGVWEEYRIPDAPFTQVSLSP